MQPFHAMVREHITTWISQYNFLAWVVCFPITDHIIFFGVLLFYPSKKYSLTCMRLFENLKPNILKSITTSSQRGNKPPKLKRSITALNRGVISVPV